MNSHRKSPNHSSHSGSGEDEKQKYQVLFNNYLVKFLAHLKKEVPSHDQMIVICYKKYRKVDRELYIKNVLKKIKPHLRYIIDRDENMFSQDYSPAPLNFLPKLDFKTLWNSESDSLSPKTQKIIWKCLQNLYISGSYAMGNGRQDPLVKEMLRNLRIEKEIRKEVKQEITQEEQEANQQLTSTSAFPEIGSIEDLFGQDNILVQLAQDISQELASQNFDLDLDQEIQNPLDVITQLFGQDQHKLENLMNTFSHKLQERMEAQNLTEDDLYQATQHIGQNLMSKMGQVPGMPDFSAFSQKTPKELAQMNPDQAEHYRQEILEKMTATMTPDQRQQFEEFNQMMTQNIDNNLEAQDQAPEENPNNERLPQLEENDSSVVQVHETETESDDPELNDELTKIKASL